MTIETTPRRVEWAGPEGWTVWADEDGCHVRTRQGEVLEMCEVERLFSLWRHAREVTQAGHVPAPKPLSREEARTQGYQRAEEYALRRAVRAIEAELAPPADSPF